MSDIERPDELAEATPPAEDTMRKQLAEIGGTQFEVVRNLDRLGLLQEGSLKRTVIAVCVEDPLKFLSNAEMQRICPELLESAVRALLATKSPDNMFQHIKLFANQPWAREVLLAAIQHGEHGRKLGSWIFGYVEHFADQPWAEEILLAAVQNDGAWGAFNDAKKLVGLPFGEKILRAAAPLNSWAALRFVDGYKNAPFARDLLVDLLSIPFKIVSREGAPQSSRPSWSNVMVRLTTGNGMSFSPSNIAVLARLPFAADILRAFATANPELVKGERDAFRDFPGARKIFKSLGLDSFAAGCRV